MLVSDPEVLPKMGQRQGWDSCSSSLLSCPGTSQAQLMLPTPCCSPWGAEVADGPNKPVCDQKVLCGPDLCQVNLNSGV